MHRLSVRFRMVWFAFLAPLAGTSVLAHDALRVGSAEAEEPVTPVDLFLSNDAPVQGFVMVFEWDGRKVLGEGVTPAGGPGEPLEGADLVVSRVEDSFIIFSAVLDLGIGGGPQPVIPPGDDRVIGTAQLRCVCPGSRQEVALALVDGRHSAADGGPLLDNIIVVAGESISETDGLELVNGTLVCNPGVDGDGVGFACGGRLEPDGTIAPAEGRPGETVTVCYYYSDPGEGDGRIQGLSMAVEYDCGISCSEDSVSIAGGAIESSAAEFFQLHCDNDGGDGDGCEMVAGMLVELEGPADGRRLPATDGFGLLFCVDFRIAEDAERGSCLAVRFVDGVDGRGTVATENLVSIDFFEQSVSVAHCEVCVVREQPFVRGDCNGNARVNIADAAAIIGLILLGEFAAPCFDACDANDDGTLTVTDAVYLLQYLFVPGNPPPPAPFPDAGEDPTADALDCSGEPGFPA